MNGMGLSFVLQAAMLVTGGQNYQEAYQATVQTGKPLLVLVGADWCPGCQIMKQTTMRELEQAGKLAPVSFASINSDQEPTLAGQLMSGQSIPQLIVYTKTDTGWQRSQLTGAQTKATVEAFIERAVEQTGARVQNAANTTAQ